VVVLVLGAIALALVTTAAVYAIRPFDLSVDLANRRIAPPGKSLAVHGRCDAAARTAWDHDAKDRLKLWAVTVGTDMMGYTPVSGSKAEYQVLGEPVGHFPDSWCGGEARHRLIVSGGMVACAVVAATLAVMLLRRGKRTQPAPVEG
jgi:hypothetical protein